MKLIFLSLLFVSSSVFAKDYFVKEPSGVADDGVKRARRAVR